MGDLIDRIGLRMLVDGDGIVDNFKNNSLYFNEKYRKSDNDVESIDVSNIKDGFFYHFLYLDDSNWMQYSPVFVTNYKKIQNTTIIYGINLNFIPLEIRAYLFDPFMIDKDFDLNRQLVVDYEGAYNNLLKLGFEYSLVEYDAYRIKLVHRISQSMVPRFLISQDPINKYDPKKLFDIWQVKLKDKSKRNQEIMSSTLDEFYNVKGEISEKYVVLKQHIQRLQTGMKKWSI